MPGEIKTDHYISSGKIRQGCFLIFYFIDVIYDRTDGAEVSAGWISIVQTAKVNGLNPGRYLNWLLSVIPSVRPKSNLDNLRKLLPWSPDVPADCFARDLEEIRTQNLDK